MRLLRFILVGTGWLAASCSMPNSVATLHGTTPQHRIAGRYVVSLRSSTAANNLAGLGEYPVRRRFGSIFTGFEVDLTPEQLKMLQSHPDVTDIYEVRQIRAFESRPVVQPYAIWNLDRLDQATYPLDSRYIYIGQGAGVHAYVVDTGIRKTHVEFEGRATFDFDAIENAGSANYMRDCNGHGTHVAGIIGAKTFGVAKKARIHGIKVLPCSGEGSDSAVAAGLEWIYDHLEKPAVVNISVGGAGVSDLIETAARRLLAKGATVVVAAGNDTVDACGFSPARVPEVITVAASAQAWGSNPSSPDQLTDVSNFGKCVDIIAPGEDIKSTFNSDDTAMAPLT